MPRIYENTLATDTQGQFYALDQSGNAKQQYSAVPYHFVSALPASPVSGQTYILTASVGNYPTGMYKHDGTGWVCVSQSSVPSLSWSGSVAETLVAGVVYNATITGNLTSIAITIDANSGSCEIIMDNSGAYDVVNPTTGLKRGSNGLDDFTANGIIEVLVSKISTNYIWSAIKTESI